MTADDALGSCPRRGESGHLPHPDGRPCIVNGPAPGVYSEDQVAASPAPNPAPGSDDTDAWLQGYRYALLNPDDPGVQADLARYQEEQREQLVDELQVRLAEALADRDHQRGKQRELVRMLEEVTLGRDKAREQAAECMREAAQLHRQLDSLGTNPDRLAEQVGAGMAVTLFGRTYVDRELASATYATARMREDVGVALDLLRNGHTDPELWAQENRAAVTRLYAFRDTRPPYDQVGADPTCDKPGHLSSACLHGGDDRVLGEGVYATAELEEAGTGVFVPVPKGHMLSVTVTPYEDQPAEAPED